MNASEPRRSISERVRHIDIAHRMTWVVTVIALGPLSKTDAAPKWTVPLLLVIALILQGALMLGSHRTVKDIKTMESSNK
jgi:hypothetical protein